ncbi:efflux RND transporter periplasmic adaptor subunit [Enhygromyxa salina]|uniref:RND efflux pump membrane fusion protein barrel-sandwich domain-containing protein n=1 Tax=Enhygromyxa salina TaxID=215803 RepID=A0A2S9XQ30_9BACT|nr:HlyD family efflux transporter periplasmic adaptor subunit [Enhygromyxa salina]PRP94801.1 hypothetical protein ENSA7_76240 [Enhygromyxa salina]
MSAWAWVPVGVTALALACVGADASAIVDSAAEGSPPSERALELELEATSTTKVADVAMLGVLVPAAEVVLVAPGIARLERLDLHVGDRIDADAVVAIVELLGQRSELAGATATWRSARAELDRLELELAEARANRAEVEDLEDFVSRAEVRERRVAEQLADARKRSADASLARERSRMNAASERLTEAELRAPFAAFVGDRYADPGATLTLGDPVVSLISEDRLVRFAVPNTEAAALELGAALVVRFADSELEFAASVSAIAPEIDAGTGLIIAEARFDGDAPRSRIGAVAQVRFAQTAVIEP